MTNNILNKLNIKNDYKPKFQIKNIEEIHSPKRIGFWGLSGCGKTYSMLLIAKHIVKNKIGIVATELGCKDACKNLGLNTARVIDLKIDANGQVSDSDYIHAIRDLENEGCDVICIDSLSPQWEYTLHKVDAYKDPRKAWGAITPCYNTFLVNLFERGAANILFTVLGKEATFKQDTPQGTIDIAFRGIKPIQRDTFMARADVVFFMEQSTKKAFATKDRTEVFKEYEGGKLITADSAVKLREYMDELNKKSDKSIEFFRIPDSIKIWNEIRDFIQAHGLEATLSSILKTLKLQNITELKPEHIDQVKKRVNEKLKETENK